MVEVFVVEKDREVVEIAPVAKPELLLPDGAVEKETRATDAIDGAVAAEGLIFKVVVLRASRFAARRQYWIAADDMVTMLTDDETRFLPTDCESKMSIPVREKKTKDSSRLPFKALGDIGCRGE